MKRPSHISEQQGERGNVILLALLIIAILAVTAANVFKNAMGRFTTTVQTAAWQEARLAADAGVDIGLAALKANLQNPATGSSWSGWYATSGASTTEIQSALSGSNGMIYNTTGGYISLPIFYNSALPSTSGSTRVDVQICTLYPEPTISTTGTSVWFRIRSMGSSTLSTPSRLAIDRMDSNLRRLFLYSNTGARVALTSTANWGTNNGPATFTASSPFTPFASRAVEVLVKPSVSSLNPISAQSTVDLGNSSGWLVDDYTTASSTTYPTANWTENYEANVTSSISDSNTAAITTNGKTVKGSAETAGGQIDGSTSGTPSNVHGTNYNYSQTLSVPAWPESTISTVNAPSSYTSISLSSGVTQYKYYDTTSPSSIKISAPSTGTYYVTMQFGDSSHAPGLSINNGKGTIQVPSNVYLTIYVSGPISLGNKDINYGSGNSNAATHLTIYGEPNTANSLSQTLTSQGSANIAALFIGPTYDITLRGDVAWFGALAGNSFNVNGGGGNGGVHFDEALNSSAQISNYSIVSYLEDSRQ